MNKPIFFDTTSVAGLIRRGVIDAANGSEPAIGGEQKETAAFEKLIEQEKSQPSFCVLRLYIAGTSAKSSRTIAKIRDLCERHMAGRYELEVIDLRQHPQLAKDERIVATPTLLRKLPLPLRRFIGDMSDSERILVGLDLKPGND